MHVHIPGITPSLMEINASERGWMRAFVSWAAAYAERYISRRMKVLSHPCS